MNHTSAIHLDMDPLSSYDYQSYESYPQPYPYPVKLEDSLYYQPNYNNIPTEQNKPNYSNIEQNHKQETASNVNVDIKPILSKKKKNGKNKNFCSQKITDANFPFYGCSVCKISFTTLNELDQHVTIHKNRMTSYRLRLRNQYKKKLMKKKEKKLKKIVKIKDEDLGIEIKPEDGYIGSEKALNFNENSSNTSNEINSNIDISNKVSNTNENSTQNDMLNVNNENSSNSINNNNSAIDNSDNNLDKLQNGADDKELDDLEKIYKCFACQKQFTLSYYLKLHVRSHTDEKPYTCAVCGQSFITASKLGRHNKRIHLAERYQCRICFKVYSRFELLTAHFDKTHPEDKLEGEPYDYNAILPYLKELEEQLREKAEDKDNKPKTEELWTTDVASIEPDVKPETGEGKFFTETVKIEEVGVEAGDVKVKVEDEELKTVEVSPDSHDECADDASAAVDDVKYEDSDSDEDYFPENTWAAAPSGPLSPAQSAQTACPARRRRGPLSCPQCNKVMSSSSYLRVHLRTHSGERPFRCYECGAGFITRSKMHRHVLTHEQDKDGVESKCEEKVKTDPEEENTETDDKNTKKKGKKKSKIKSKSKSKTEAKPRQKNSKRPHACEYCNQKFLHLNMLEVHRKSHAGELCVLRCEFCLHEAADASELSEHRTQHVGPRPYLCTVCGRTYKKRETMVYHRKQHRAGLVCEVCSARLTSRAALTQHMRSHRTRFVLRYECPVCAHMFHTRYHVHMHLATHQREGLILEENRNEILAMVLQNARKIPKQADAPANLSDVIPTDERSRICNICGEIFHHFFYLEEHLKSHGSKIAVEDIAKEEEKKYICPICNKGFKLHYYLKLHSFTHSKEKPFICQQCGKGFITRGKLKRHLETHSGLKKYQCHICYKFFTRPSYLRIHIRTIHGTQDYNFRFDKNSFGFSSGVDNGLPTAGSQNSV